MHKFKTIKDHGKTRRLAEIQSKHSKMRARKAQLKKLKALRDEQNFRESAFCQYR